MIRKHKKASDVFNESTPFIANKSSFDNAFPDAEDIIIECDEVECIGGTKSWKHRYTKENIPGEFIDCHNPRCYNGGFSIGEVMEDMISKNETKRNGATCCQGNEGTPKGRRIYHSCPHHFNYAISIKHKD
jgi:hypothetical protein